MTALAIVGVLLLVLLNAFFVSAEYALVRAAALAPGGDGAGGAGAARGWP